MRKTDSSSKTLTSYHRQSPVQGFTPDTLKFLRQLKRNNNREWFLAHKNIYELKVKAPMMELTLELGYHLQQIAPELAADPHRAIFRIYRDIRFSADKSPYKTNIAARFFPSGMPKNAGAGLYFHVEPAQVMIAGGVYMPDAATLRILRKHIATNWKDFLAITSQRDFRKLFGTVQGERLARPPKGFSADHPAIEVLRLKQFYVMRTEFEEFALGPDFLPRLVAIFSAMIPLIRFFNDPLKSQPGSPSVAALDGTPIRFSGD